MACVPNSFILTPRPMPLHVNEKIHLESCIAKVEVFKKEKSCCSPMKEV